MPDDFANPFANYGRIVSGDRFIGRKEDLSAIEKRLFISEPANLAIIGGPQVGKSSLVHQAITIYAHRLLQNSFLPVWINLATYSRSYDFFYALPKRCMQELKEHEFQIDAVIQYAAEDCQQEERSGRVDFETVKYFFEKVRKANIRVLFILDEFDDARRIFKDDDTGFQRLRELSYQPSCGVTYITTSRRTVYQIELQTGFSSTLDGIFSDYYLGPFEGEGLQHYFSRLDAIGISATSALRESIDFYAGGHPYLLDMLNYELVEIFRQQKTIDVGRAYEKKAPSFTHYYKHMQRLLEEDNRLNKLLQILCGPVVDVNHTDVDGFLAYGLIKKGSGDTYRAFAPHFQAYLNLISRKFPLWPMLTQTEEALRATIEKALHHLYGDLWIDKLEKNHASLKRVFQRCRKQQQSDLKEHGRFSKNILDNTYISDLFEIVSLEWYNAQFMNTFKMTKDDWDIRAKFLRPVRNALAHNKDKAVINEFQRQQAEVYFREILAALQ